MNDTYAPSRSKAFFYCSLLPLSTERKGLENVGNVAHTTHCTQCNYDN